MSFTLLLLTLLSVQPALFSQTCCHSIYFHSGVASNDLLRVGCDKLHRKYGIVHNGSCLGSPLHIAVGATYDIMYDLDFFRATYVSVIDASEITVTPNYFNDPPSQGSFNYILDPLPIYYPGNSDYVLTYFEYQFDLNFGNPTAGSGNPPSSYIALGLGIRCNVNDSFNGVDLYSAGGASGVRVNGNWSDLKNDPDISIFLNVTPGIHITEELIIDDIQEIIGGFQDVSYITGDPGYKITTLTDVDFIHCAITGCTEMWRGFDVKEGSQLGFIDSEVKDAEIAVKLNPASKVTASNSSFINNAYGVWDEQGTFVELGTVTFTSEAENWLPAFTGQTHQPINGIGLAGVVSSGGFILATEGTYSNLYNGIVANNSTVDINQTHFNSMHHLAPFMQGNGILLINPTGSKSALISNRSSFENCLTGIRIAGQRTKVLNSAFADVAYGISALNTSASLTMDYDTIQSTIYGIQLNNCPGALKTIQNSIFTNSGNSTIDDGCIYIQNPASFSLIRNNQMTVQGGIFGFRTTPGAPSSLYNNTSTLANTTRSHGFGFHLSGNRSNLSCNTAAGPSSTNKDLYGYQVVMANANFNCNLSDGGRRGFNVSGSNAMSAFRGNEIGGIYGLRVESNGRLGLSTTLMHQGNCWPGSSIKDALNDNSDPSIVEFSQFTVDEQEMACFLPDWEAQGDWFDNIPDQNTSYACESLCPNGGAGAGFGPDICDYAEELIPLTNNSVSYTAYQNEMRWLDRYQVYKLLTEADCSGLSQTLRNFISAMASSEIGKLAEIDIRLNALAASSEDADQIQIDSLHQNHDSLIFQIKDLLEETWFKWDTSIVVELLDEMAIIQAEIDSLVEVKNEWYIGQLEEILVDNSEISTNSTIAAQLKWVNGLMITTMLSDTLLHLDSEDENDLLDIAFLCPEEGGYSTLKARGLLHTLGYTEVFDDRHCYDSTIQALKTPIMPLGLTLTPNPTSSFIFIEASGQPIYSIQFISTMGQLIFEQKGGGANYVSSQTDQLTLGTYMVVCTLIDGTVLRSKLIVNR
ncbi:MAG: T9SS type A sorting domain-containing protein [Saprospiraceae bacterium]|nr:T9SS type A sorting domain-containing protein [Saprospiraceae bacterium]